MLKFIRQEEDGEFTFNPDSVEEYLALRHAPPAKGKQETAENPDMAQEESAFLKEKTEE